MKKHLNLIQVLRAAAILFVLIGHLTGLFYKRYEVNLLGMGEWGRTGGVDMFFVISGFMIAYLYKNKLGNPSHAAGFLQKRFLRIFPYYWLVTLGAITMLFLFPDFGDPFTLTHITTSMLLISEDPILTVAWSLTHIVFFYILFSLLIARPLIGAAIVGTYLTSIVTFYFIDFYPTNTLAATLLNVSNLTIWLGAFVAFAITKYTPKPAIGALATAIGMTAFLFLWINNTYELVGIERWTIRPFLYGLSSCFLVAGLATIDLTLNIKITKPLRELGNASFSIFLTHGLFLMYFMHVLIGKWTLQQTLGWHLTMLLTATLTLLAGIASYYLIEKPLNSLLKKRRDTTRDSLAA
ncbi:Acyltransferase family protein [Bacillus sp. THAF10]|uniref:acyltransferase family protein n=1 Tax=Bacillus sp. THAF10 TaxID=2587848 RepID=UPI0012AA97BE|nr:acyltransferase [Bacillus sp. THAF10]QFT90885.1 Acyltransferase family protein [Bacillus sp. THAF10]